MNQAELIKEIIEYTLLIEEKKKVEENLINLKYEINHKSKTIAGTVSRLGMPDKFVVHFTEEQNNILENKVIYISLIEDWWESSNALEVSILKEY